MKITAEKLLNSNPFYNCVGRTIKSMKWDWKELTIYFTDDTFIKFEVLAADREAYLWITETNVIK